MGSLKDKVVLITDVTSPVGREAAETLAQHGAFVIMCGRNQIIVQEVEAELKRKSYKNFKVHIQTETNYDQSVKQTVDDVVNTVKRIHGVVFTHDAEYKGTFENTSARDLEKSLESLMEPMMLWYQATRRHVASSKGSYVIVSSSASTKVSLGNIPYSVSKAGLDMYTKLIAMEMVKEGVTVNSLNPTITSESPASLNGGVTTKDTAEHIAFLLGDTAKFSTGRNILLEGI